VSNAYLHVEPQVWQTRIDAGPGGIVGQCPRHTPVDVDLVGSGGRVFSMSIGEMLEFIRLDGLDIVPIYAIKVVVLTLENGAFEREIARSVTDFNALSKAYVPLIAAANDTAEWGERGLRRTVVGAAAEKIRSVTLTNDSGRSCAVYVDISHVEET